jgi:hypothetical protein
MADLSTTLTEPSNRVRPVPPRPSLAAALGLLLTGIGHAATLAYVAPYHRKAPARDRCPDGRDPSW